MKTGYLFFVFVITAQFSFAQSEHQIALLTGLQRYLTREPILSPLLYRGSYLPWQLSYSYTADQHYHEVHVTHGSGELTFTITSANALGRQHYTELLVWQLQYAYLRRIGSLSHYQWYGGGTLRAAYFDKELNYIVGREGRTADVFITPALTTAVISQYRKQRIRGQVAFSPFAYVAARTYAANRPPLPLIDQKLSVSNALKYGDWLGLPQFAAYWGELAYGYQCGRHWQAHLSYQFQYYRYDKLNPFTVRSVVHTLLAGISINL